MTTNNPICVQGALWVLSPAQVGGWCLLTAEPSVRVTVDILVNGTLAAAMVAAQFFDGAGDGRHGFTLRLPAPLSGPGTQVVEARERRSGAIFARVVLFAEQRAQKLEARLAALDRDMLRGSRIIHGPDDPEGTQGAVRALATTLEETRLDAFARAHAQMRRRAPRLALAVAPDWSFIVPSDGGAAAVLARLVALQPLCDTVAAEILLQDDGADPATLLLAQAVPGLRHMLERSPSAGVRLNMLVQEAKGATLFFMDDSIAPQASFHLAGQVHIGGAVTQAAAGMAEIWQPMVRRCVPGGFALQVPRNWLQAAGGFDISLHANAAFADLALKCGLLGMQVVAWLDHDEAVPRQWRVQALAS